VNSHSPYGKSNEQMTRP